MNNLPKVSLDSHGSNLRLLHHHASALATRLSSHPSSVYSATILLSFDTVQIQWRCSTYCPSFTACDIEYMYRITTTSIQKTSFFSAAIDYLCSSSSIAFCLTNIYISCVQYILTSIHYIVLRSSRHEHLLHLITTDCCADK